MFVSKIVQQYMICFSEHLGQAEYAEYYILPIKRNVPIPLYRFEGNGIFYDYPRDIKAYYEPQEVGDAIFRQLRHLKWYRNGKSYRFGLSKCNPDSLKVDPTLKPID